MHAALVKVPPDQLDTEVKVWAGKARDLSYRVEDVVDVFMVGLGGAPTRPPLSVRTPFQTPKALRLKCNTRCF